MTVRLLGTGDAAGWPNPFCDCHSCTQERAAGRFRANTAILVDGVILIDCGPTVPAVAAACGLSLGSVEHVLITHGHPDHCDPRNLLARNWSSAGHPLQVWGPLRAMEQCRPWLGPDDPISLRIIGPGTVGGWRLATTAGEYRVEAIAAAHGSSAGVGDELAAEALIYSLTTPTGARILYATDTGPLTDDALESLRGPYDLVLVEQTFGTFADHRTGHHDIGSLARELDRWRTAGHIDADTRVVAIHLGHHNPPLPELRDIMSLMHVEVLDDGAQLDVNTATRAGSHAPAAPRTAAPPLHAASARVTKPTRALVLGGTRSGKSSWAEARATALADAHGALGARSGHSAYSAPGGGGVVVVATGPVADADVDPEWAERVLAHRARRPQTWRTIETSDPASVIRSAHGGECCIVDCLGTWLTRVLDDAGAWHGPGSDRARAIADAAVDGLLDALASSRASVVIVSNEVGMSLVPTTPSGRVFTDVLGHANRRISAACDEVVLMIAGRALPLAAEGASDPGSWSS